MIGPKAELPTEDWVRVFQEARDLGILHLHLTGGEPLARADLKDLIEAAHAAGLYTNLITSGIGLPEARLKTLVDAGLDHIQLSFQDSRDEPANWIAGTKAHAHKIVLSEVIRRLPIAFTVNLVVHRQNLDHLEEMIGFAEQLKPHRLEIAHAQYYGWALKNRDTLIPSREQLENCMRIVEAAQERLSGRIRIDCVVPDYYARYPKACMGGWGRRLLLIDPAGQVLPCHAAGVIPGMTFDNVREHSLDWIWRESDAFQRFRGEQWHAKVFMHVRSDLEHVWSGHAAERERVRIQKTEQELTKMQADLDQGRFDNGILNDVIDSVRKSSNDDRLAPRDRAVLADDVVRLKDYQDHHNHWR